MKLTFPTLLAACCFAMPAIAESEGDAMLDMTNNVLAALVGDSEETAPPKATDGDLSSLVHQAMAAGQSDAYLEALVSEAAAQGRIEVPDAMRTTEGDVDTKSLIASIVAEATSAPTDDTQTHLTAEAGGAPKEKIYHTVQSGDSLGRIALAYYDNPNAYVQIFEANRESISRPDLIRVGQVILIP